MGPGGPVNLLLGLASELLLETAQATHPELCPEPSASAQLMPKLVVPKKLRGRGAGEAQQCVGVSPTLLPDLIFSLSLVSC